MKRGKEMSNKIIYFARDLLEQGKDFVIAKVVDTKGSTPRKKGAWLLMKEDGTRLGTVGGGRLEAVTEELCKETFKTKEKSKIHHFKLNTEEKDALDMGCGGDADVLIEYIDAAHPEEFKAEFNLKSAAYIYGAGHVGLALEPILRYVDFQTVVIDDRAEYANRERFKEADEVKVISSFKEPFKEIETNEDSYIIIVTRGHMGDLDVLRDALRQKSAYVGMIGSKSKNKMLFDMLREEGYSEEELGKVYAPIGLSIHAETPEEIAISVVGEMIQVRAGYGK
ncbi:MAG: XdhC/CoxI family protein [Anaerovoracaceae bacterium]